MIDACFPKAQQPVCKNDRSYSLMTLRLSAPISMCASYSEIYLNELTLRIHIGQIANVPRAAHGKRIVGFELLENHFCLIE